MGQFGEASCSPTYKMVSTLVLLPLLAGIAAAQLPVPGTLPGVGDIAAQQAWINAQLAPLNMQSQHTQVQLLALAGRKKRSVPLPGTESVAALTYNPAAQAYWHQAQLQQQQNIINQKALELGAAGGKKKRSAQLPVPGSIPSVGDLAAQQAWINAQPAYINMQHQFTQVQLQSLTAGRKRRSVPLPGTESVAALTYNPAAQAYWYQAQLQQQQNLINQKALELGPAGR